ncbi:hypothetical protein MBLNU457_4373t1 [Dothideomycetes sp. NU457]
MLSDSDSYREGSDYGTDITTPSSSDRGGDTDNEEVEALRNSEYSQMKGGVYLDHGGATQYAKSLFDAFHKDMTSNLYGNPHSASRPSALAGHKVDAIREKALRFFKADPKDWDLVFTANATASMKLVIECMRDAASTTNTPLWVGYHKDAHTSLVGMRELARTHRCFDSDVQVDVWIESGGLGGPRSRELGLFAYPGQSNMTGRRLPLDWSDRIRRRLNRCEIYTLLDAAALASTAAIDLSDEFTAPDFVSLSFYKIFGYPDLGALLVRKRSSHILENRRYFGGGTVDMIVAVQDTWHAKKEGALHNRLEDGTVPFHNIIALGHAIDVHERLYGPEPMKFISRHSGKLARDLYNSLSSLRHANGLPVAIIYKDSTAVYGNSDLQGATIAFNLRRADGAIVGYEEVEKLADEHNIYVRSGSLCNPGGVATYLSWSPAEMRAAYANGHRCSHPVQNVAGKATGVVRVSLGGMSTARDVQTFLAFVRRYYVDEEVRIAWPLQNQSSQIATPPQTTGTSLSSLPDPPTVSSQNHKVIHIVTQSTQLPARQKSLHEQRFNTSSRLVKKSHIIYPPSPPQSPGYSSEEIPKYLCHMAPPPPPPPEPQSTPTEPMLKSKRSIIRKSMAGLLRRT